MKLGDLEESNRIEFAKAYGVFDVIVEAGTDTEAASMSAHVEEGCAGSRIRLREAPVADEKAGTSPVTYAVPEGSIAAPWSMDTERVLVQDRSSESAAQRRTLLGSYAARAPSTNGNRGTSAILNFEASSFNAAQSGFPAE